MNHKKKFSIASVTALIAAFLSFKSGAILGLLLALVAIAAGLFGIFRALSPRYRGGIASTLAIAAGGIGIIAAGFKTLSWIF